MSLQLGAPEPLSGCPILDDFACDAVDRAIAVSQQAGVQALLVHALHERAKQFYEHYGFQASPANPMTLMLRLASVNA